MILSKSEDESHRDYDDTALTGDEVEDSHISGVVKWSESARKFMFQSHKVRSTEGDYM